MKAWAYLLVLLLGTPASAQALTEKESITVSNLTAVRIMQKNCQEKYTFNKKNIDIISRALGVNIDNKKYSSEMKRQTKLINGYFKEIGPKFCDYYFAELTKAHMNGVMFKR